MKNKTIIISFTVIALALIFKFGLSLYGKLNTEEKQKEIKQEISTLVIDMNYNFSFDEFDYEFLISEEQIIEKSSTGKINGLDDKYLIKKDGFELMSLTFLPKETEKYLDQTYSSYLEEEILINGIVGSLFKSNGKNIAYILKDEKYNYLWVNNDYEKFDEIVKTFKKQ